MLNLNKNQIGLIAEAVKDIGFAAFGIFGLPAVNKVFTGEAIKIPDVAMLIMGAVCFLVLFGLSLAIMKGTDDSEPSEPVAEEEVHSNKENAGNSEPK